MNLISIKRNEYSDQLNQLKLSLGNQLHFVSLCGDTSDSSLTIFAELAISP
jgi:hypothetical protein